MSFAAHPFTSRIPAVADRGASPILMALGCFFPLIGAHKVLAAYGCLIPRLVTGRFDPARHKAVWPSTGNYCRGGIAISRILNCRGIAVLPEGMSEERFDWLRAWTPRPEDIVRTPGSESNVKEIYDKCAELARDPRQCDPQPIRRIRQLHCPPCVHRSGAGPRFRCIAGTTAEAAVGRFCRSLGFRRHARRW